MQVAEVPEGLAAMAVGAELAAALQVIEPAEVPNDRMLEVVVAQYRQLCHDQARMAAALAELSRCCGRAEPGQVLRAVLPDRFAPDETRAALRWTRQAAENEHGLAESVVWGMPLVLEAWLAGVVDRPRVRVFDQYLTGLAAEQVERICQIALPRAPSLTTGQLAHLLRRMVIAVDPDAAARWYRKGVRERNVTAYPAPDGTITISANGLLADQAEAACERVQQLAAAAKRAGHPGVLGQVRCDLFLGLLDGRFHGMSTEQVIAALIRDYRPAGPAGEVAVVQDSTGGVATQDGPTQDGPTPDGLTDDGLTDDGPTQDGPTQDGPTQDGPTRGTPIPQARVAGAQTAEVQTTDVQTSEFQTGNGLASGDPMDRGLPSDGPAGGGGVVPSPGVDGSCDENTGGAGSGVPASGGGAVDERVGIEIRVGLATLLGWDEHPGEIPGLGLLIAPDARLRVALQGRAEWRFAVTDAEGALLSEGRTRHRPVGVGRDGPRGGIVELHVPAALLHELVADPGLCPGWGAVVADIAAQHADRERHLADLDAHPEARLPGAALRRHTEIRDRTCTFAGVCRRPARAGEIDHSRDRARGGRTERINLGPVCDHDHDVKHRAGWTVTQPEPGTFVWHSPLGGEYVTRGEFLLPELPDPVDHDPDPDPWPDPGPTRTPRVVDGPILRRPPPPQPAPPQTPAPDYPDEPPC